MTRIWTAVVAAVVPAVVAAITAGFLGYAWTLRALRYPGAAELVGLPGRIVGRLAGR